MTMRPGRRWNLGVTCLKVLCETSCIDVGYQ
jgi:hypothetical protein